MNIFRPDIKRKTLGQREAGYIWFGPKPRRSWFSSACCRAQGLNRTLFWWARHCSRYREP